MHIKALLWDCDGTLVDSEIVAMKTGLDLVYGFFNRSYAPEAISRLAGNSFRQSCEIIAKEAGQTLTEEDYQHLDQRQMEETVAALSAQVEPTDGAWEQLAAFAPKVSLAVVTSSSLQRVNPCLDRVLSNGLSLRQFFPDARVFSAEDPRIFPDGPRTKPDPSIYLHATQALGLDSAHCIALEDSPSGVKSAVRAGIPVIGYVGGKHIAHPEKQAARLLEAAAHPGEGYAGIPSLIVIEHMSELPAVVTALEQATSYQEACLAFA